MSKGKFKENVEWLSDPKIAITVAVLVLIGIALAIFVWKKIKKTAEGIADGIKDNREDSDIEKETGSLITSLLDFKSLCAQIWDASVNATINDPDKVCQALQQLQSKADYEKLKRVWTDYVEGLNWWERNLHAFSETKYSLPASLAADFKEKNLERFREVLRKKNITPDF